MTHHILSDIAKEGKSAFLVIKTEVTANNSMLILIIITQFFDP